LLTYHLHVFKTVSDRMSKVKNAQKKKKKKSSE